MSPAPETGTWNPHAQSNMQADGHGWLAIVAVIIASFAALLFLAVNASRDGVAIAGGSDLEQQTVGSQAP